MVQSKLACSYGEQWMRKRKDINRKKNKIYLEKENFGSELFSDAQKKRTKVNEKK